MMLAYNNRRHAPPVAGAPALEISRANVRHPGASTLALVNINLRVPAGQHVALVGHNGAGKSTLLKTVAGLLRTDGLVRIYGLPIGACHHRVAYLPQRGEVDWRFPISVRRLVMTGRYVHLGWFRRPSMRDEQVVDAALETLKLTGLAERQIGQLSGGQQQRAMLARALAQEAELLLLDEPLNAVDAGTREVISRALADLIRNGKTIIVATHEIDRRDSDFGGVVQMSGGKIIAAPLQVLENEYELDF